MRLTCLFKAFRVLGIAACAAGGAAACHERPSELTDIADNEAEANSSPSAGEPGEQRSLSDFGSPFVVDPLVVRRLALCEPILLRFGPDDPTKNVPTVALVRSSVVSSSTLLQSVGMLPVGGKARFKVFAETNPEASALAKAVIRSFRDLTTICDGLKAPLTEHAWTQAVLGTNSLSSPPLRVDLCPQSFSNVAIPISPEQVFVELRDESAFARDPFFHTTLYNHGNRDVYVKRLNEQGKSPVFLGILAGNKRGYSFEYDSSFAPFYVKKGTPGIPIQNPEFSQIGYSVLIDYWSTRGIAVETPFLLRTTIQLSAETGKSNLSFTLWTTSQPVPVREAVH